MKKGWLHVVKKHYKHHYVIIYYTVQNNSLPPFPQNTTLHMQYNSITIHTGLAQCNSTKYGCMLALRVGRSWKLCWLS